MSDTLQFTLYPFTHKGINFVSRISQDCRYAGMISTMGEAFIQMNKDAIDELINLDTIYSMKDLDLAIQEINAGGTQMFLELAGE
jgi:hypothetical protein